METNVVQYIQNLFKSEVELARVVDELKHELIEFIENYADRVHRELQAAQAERAGDHRPDQPDTGRVDRRQR